MSNSADFDAHIALNRFGYGLKRGARVPTDPRGYLLTQLDRFDPEPQPIAGRGDMMEKPGEMLEMLRRLRRQRQSEAGAQDMASMETMGSQAGESRTDPLNGLPDEVRQSYRRSGEALRADIGLRTNLAIASDTPFAERLVHFWSNHFSVSAQKPGTHYLVANHEFHAIRPHLTGKFSDMLKSAVLHPAMLIYLDQFRSIGPGSQFQQFRARQRNRRGSNEPDLGLNENLAREVLELHTLGVDGGYDQADVTELARALTGWTIAGIRRMARFTQDKANGAAFAAPAHEPGTRRIMGKSYRASGADQAIAVLDDLAAHPATARFIATKLARHFAGDTPPDSLVARLERDFKESGGDLGSLSRTLVASPEVWAEGPVKYRQPFEWLVSILRFTGIDNLNSRRISGGLDQLGQLPWRAPSPAGYDDLEGSWAGPDALLRRVELAERIARGARADNIMDRANAAFPAGGLSDHTSTWLSRAESGQQALGLLLVSPEMLRR
ncbi:MAG: DUF1800 domain-containing protein [Pseudomonadota bacterium]